MGIDAQVYIKLPYEPTTDQLKLWSWDLCARLGANRFMLNQETGCMSLAESYGEGPLGKVVVQDGPSLIADENSWFVDVAVWTRYYGIGYERGDLLFLCALAEWIERNIKGAEVLYGGDSSGVLASPFTKEVRESLLSHFYSASGRDYFNYMGWQEPPVPPRCSLCPSERGPRRFGWGGDYAAWHCPGCDKKFYSRDNGVTWQFEDKQA